MDESEKRKERLKAMRIEAEVSNDVEISSIPGYLSNPLTETISTAQDDSFAAPRFDYYTDPMAAYSGNKIRGNNHNQNPQTSFAPPPIMGGPMPRPAPFQPGPRNFDRDFPVHQMQPHFPPDQGVYRHGPYDPKMRSPSPMHQGQVNNAWNGSQATDHYNFVPDGSPRGMFGNPPMYPGTPHRAWNPSHASGYGNFPRPGLSPADSPNFNYGTGRPQMYGNRPNRPFLDQGAGGNPYPGRGRGRGYSGNNSPGFGRSGGRGQGFRGRGSAPNSTLGPERYFNESMLEDPWQHLKPIPLRRQETGMDGSSTHGTSNSWLPKSIGIKKAKVSEASSNKFNSHQSLAEYLASSFNKAVEEDPPNP